MQQSLFPTYGSEASPVKTSLLRAWVKEKDLEELSLDSFMSLLDWLEKASPEFLFSKTLRVSSAPTGEMTFPFFSKRWPSSGILSDGVLLTADTLEYPSHVNESTLSGVLETGEVPEQYFLSPNAARGVLRRADRMGRNLRPHFRQSLEILAETDQSSKQLPTASTPPRPATRVLTGAETTPATRKAAASGGSRRPSAKE